MLAVTPLVDQTSAEALKGNRKEHRRNLRGQFCKQNSNGAGDRGQKNLTPPLLSDGKAQRYRMNFRKYVEEGTGKAQRGRRAGEKQRDRSPCQLFG